MPSEVSTRVVKYESISFTEKQCKHCHEFRFKLTDSEWERVKEGFLRFKKSNTVVVNNIKELHYRDSSTVTF